MFTARKALQIHYAMFAGGLALVAYFVLVYLPLREKARALDEPLRKVRQHLIDINLESPFVGGLEPEEIAENLRRLEEDLATLQHSEKTILSRIELDAPTRAKLREPFQLIDYRNERQLRIEELTARARKQVVALQPAAILGFPEYITDRPDPALLWAQLNLVNHLLALAAQAKVTSIESLQTPAPEPLRMAEGGGIFLDAIPIWVELTGPAEALNRFLRVLPLRTEEAKALGLPEPLPAKPALFIERLALRKITPEKVDQGHLELQLRGYVYRE